MEELLKIKRNYAGAFFELGYSELYMCNKVAAIDAFGKAKKDKTYRKSSKHYEAVTQKSIFKSYGNIWRSYKNKKNSYKTQCDTTNSS